MKHRSYEKLVKKTHSQIPAFGKRCLAPLSEELVISFGLHLLQLGLAGQHRQSWEHLSVPALGALASGTQWAFQLRHFTTATYSVGGVNWKQEGKGCVRHLNQVEPFQRNTRSKNLSEAQSWLKCLTCLWNLAPEVSATEYLGKPESGL